jgi:hypothetical protein
MAISRFRAIGRGALWLRGSGIERCCPLTNSRQRTRRQGGITGRRSRRQRLLRGKLRCERDRLEMAGQRRSPDCRVPKQLTSYTRSGYRPRSFMGCDGGRSRHWPSAIDDRSKDSQDVTSGVGHQGGPALCRHRLGCARSLWHYDAWHRIAPATAALSARAQIQALHP